MNYLFNVNFSKLPLSNISSSEKNYLTRRTTSTAVVAAVEWDCVLLTTLISVFIKHVAVEVTWKWLRQHKLTVPPESRVQPHTQS